MVNAITFDGGGILGSLSAKLVSRLEDESGLDFGKVDVFAGTSIGSANACWLADGRGCDELNSLYREMGEKVFKKRFPWSGIVGSKYSPKKLAGILGDIWGYKRLGDLKKKVLIPAFDLCGKVKGVKRWKPKFFHNYGGKDDSEVTIVSALLASMAAPVYFPTFGGYCDGGVVANNPSMACHTQIKKYKPHEPVRLLSIGTGTYSRFIEGNRNNWGLAKWSTSIIDILMNGVEQVNHEHMKIILGSDYFRLDPTFDILYSIDDVSFLDVVDVIAGAEDLTDVGSFVRGMMA